MYFSCEINMDNDAFTDYPEIELGNILNRVRRQIRDESNGEIIMDSNGNKEGAWRIMK